MRFTIVTILPEIARAFFTEGLLAKAVQKNAIQVNVVALRDFAEAPHYRVDDKPFGGGPGMILQVEPIVKALRSLPTAGDERRRVILLSAKGAQFTQSEAVRYQRDYNHLVFICGRYEGVDERIREFYADEEVSIGPFVMMGGEVAAAAIVEAVGRLVPEVLGNPTSIVSESFSDPSYLEHEQYSRPREFEGHAVPAVLLEGNHSAIAAWRKERSKKESRT